MKKHVDKRPARKSLQRTGARTSAVAHAKPRTRQARPSAAAESVPAYIAALPPAQRAVVQRFDALVERVVPGIQRIIKWRMPFYGIKGRGWLVSCGMFSDEVRITFFQGRVLRPVPPVGEGHLRGISIRKLEDLDARQIGSWVRQAAKLPGFGSKSSG